jgi:hypothetical protein
VTKGNFNFTRQYLLHLQHHHSTNHLTCPATPPTLPAPSSLPKAFAQCCTGHVHTGDACQGHQSSAHRSTIPISLPGHQSSAHHSTVPFSCQDWLTHTHTHTSPTCTHCARHTIHWTPSTHTSTHNHPTPHKKHTQAALPADTSVPTYPHHLQPHSAQCVAGCLPQQCSHTATLQKASACAVCMRQRAYQLQPPRGRSQWACAKIRDILLEMH